MKIALFTPYLPAPPTTGGRIRTHHLARAAQELGEVHLFATAAPRELLNEAAREALSGYATATVRPAPLRFLPALCLAQRVRTGVAPSLVRAFMRAHRNDSFSLIWVEHAHAARAALSVGLPWVLDEHNIESEYLRAKLEASGTVGMIGKRELEKLGCWERLLWQKATEVVCVTDSDAEIVRSVRGRSPELVPNGVDLDAIEPRWPAERAGTEILFVGLLNHPPNEHAARFLAEEVMPLVWRERNNARLVLCGRNPSRAVTKLVAKRVEVAANVPSVIPHLQRARVYANAVSQGGGSSLKVLEAFAAGVPLVSTRVGVRGFPVRAGEHYLAAESAPEFARALLRCMGPGLEHDRRAKAARALAENYSFAELGARFRDVLQRAAARGS